MKYVYLTQDQQDDVVAQAILDREKEYYHYQLNQTTYELILQSKEIQALPTDWPENIKTFRQLTGEALAAVLKGDDYALAVQIQYRDRVQALLATTLAEKGKVEATYNALTAQLPDGAARDAAVARVLTSTLAVTPTPATPVTPAPTPITPAPTV